MWEELRFALLRCSKLEIPGHYRIDMPQIVSAMNIVLNSLCVCHAATFKVMERVCLSLSGIQDHYPIEALLNVLALGMGL